MGWGRGENNTMGHHVQTYPWVMVGAIGLALAAPVLAQTDLTIDPKTQSFQNRLLRSGDLEIKVDYTADPKDDGIPNLRYELRYLGDPGDTEHFAEFTAHLGSIRLKDIDGDHQPEVIVTTFSGGAHCCTKVIVHRWQLFPWQRNRFIRAEIGPLGGGGTFRDLDGDGQEEFVTTDDRFLYRFSSYAASMPPSMIWRFQGDTLNKFADVTRNYPHYLRQEAIQMKKDFLEARARGEVYEVNGFLAGYVAQKALIGELDEAWAFMLQNYDRQREWGLEIYRGDRQMGRYASFPDALKAFLRESGYL